VADEAVLKTLHRKKHKNSPVRYALHRTNTEYSKQIFPEKELRGHSPNLHIPVSVSDLYIPTIALHILLQEICGPILGIYKSKYKWVCEVRGKQVESLF
jgi:hypothetical protein